MQICEPDWPSSSMRGIQTEPDSRIYALTNLSSAINQTDLLWLPVSSDIFVDFSLQEIQFLCE